MIESTRVNLPLKEEIDVNNLMLGMYIEDLDCTWLNSPFHLQGLLLQDDEEINLIRKICKTVTIDRSLSVGEHRISNKVEVPKNATEKLPALADNIRMPGARRYEDRTKEDKLKEKSKASSSTTFSTLLLSFIRHICSSSKNGLTKYFRTILNIRIENSKQIDDTHFSNFELHSNPVDLNNEEDVIPVENEIANVVDSFNKTKSITREIFESFANKSNIPIGPIQESLDNLIESIERNPDALIWLTKLSQSNNKIYDHALNVSINLMALAKSMEFPKVQIKELGLAGLLQDIGMISIDEKVLSNYSGLNKKDVDLIRTHIENGLNILNHSGDLSRNILKIISQHHERYDGSGYPNKLAGNQICIEAQMSGMIDTYCEIMTVNNNKIGTCHQDALDYMYKLKNTEFSEVLIDQLIQYLGIYPVSSLVELNTGEIAVVIQQNRIRRLQPRVLVLLGPDKKKNSHFINLLHSPLTPDGIPYKIKCGVTPESCGLDPADFYSWYK